MMKIVKKFVLLLIFVITINFPGYGSQDIPISNSKFVNLDNSKFTEGGYTVYVLIDGTWWAFEYDEAGNLIKVYMVSDPGV